MRQKFWGNDHMKPWSLAAIGGGVVIGLAVLASVGSAQPGASNGQVLFSGRCASCHDAGLDRAPETAALRRLTPAAIAT